MHGTHVLNVAVPLPSSINTLSALVSEQLIPQDVASLATLEQETCDASADQWASITGLALQHGLGPMLYHVLRKSNVLHLLRPSTLTTLRSYYFRSTTWSLLAHKQVEVWTKQFAESDIVAVWIKGVPLSLAVFPSPELRPMSDIDVLVPMGQLHQALALVKSKTGRAPIMKHDIGQAICQLGPGKDVKMDLHWSLIDAPDSSAAAEVDWFLAQRDPLLSRTARLLTLRPEAHLLYLCAHAQIQHNEKQFRLLRYFDLHRLIANSPSFDWQIVINQAIAFGWAYAVERALMIAQRFFATSLPNGVLMELRQWRTTHRDAPSGSCRQMPANRWERTLVRFANRSWLAKLRLAFRLAFPSLAYMRWRYDVNAVWMLPLYYPYRWLDACGEVVRTVGKRMRGG